MPPKVRKDQLLKFADDVTQRMADWQHKKDARSRGAPRCSGVQIWCRKSQQGHFFVGTQECERYLLVKLYLIVYI